MQEKLTNFFKNEKLMSLCVSVSVVCCIFALIWNLFVRKINPLYWSFSLWLVVLSCIYSIIIFYTYKIHDENAMKPSIGMLLGVITFSSLVVFSDNILDPDVATSYFNAGVVGYISLCLDFFQFLFNLLICFNHIFVSSGHKNSKKQLIINEVLFLLVIVVYVLQVIFAIPLFDTQKIIYIVAYYLMLLNTVCIVICVEAKLDYFRLLRETNSKQ